MQGEESLHCKELTCLYGQLGPNMLVNIPDDIDCGKNVASVLIGVEEVQSDDVHQHIQDNECV